MSVEHIETDVVYKHSQWGEVLVTNIATTYDQWNVVSSNGMSQKNNLVFFYKQFDEYGKIQNEPLSESVEQFASKATRERIFEKDGVSDLLVEEGEEDFDRKL